MPIVGTSPEAIDIAEDRERFQQLLHQLGLKQPPNRTARTEAEALRVADRIRLALHTHPMQTRFRARALTASIGIASSRHHGLLLETLIAAADTAVYESKRLGRDRASVARSTVPRS